MRARTKIALFLALSAGATAVPAIPTANNKFGIGCYSDTPGSPPLTAQLASAFNLSGVGGWVTLFLQFQPATQPAPLPEHAAALHTAFSLGLRPLVRLGLIARNYRDLADDAPAGHARYTTLAADYARFVNALPRPPDATPLHVIVGNEPNICGEWRCSSGAPLSSSAAAVESAAFARDVLGALVQLPRIALAAAPIAVIGHTWCACVGGAKGPQSENGTAFLSAQLAAVPTLFADTQSFAAHPYPLCAGPFSNTCARGWLSTYRQQWELALPSWRAGALAQRSGARWPIHISETGWSGADEAGKARWIVDAFEQLWLPDDNVSAVTPFLLGGTTWTAAGWPWTRWSADSQTLIGVQPQYAAVQALAAAHAVG